MLLCADLSFARFATIDDAEVATSMYNRTIKINKDGSYSETIEIIMEPLKESGKDQLVSMPLYYNAASSTMKILSAKVVNQNGTEHPVDLANIEDKPLASSPHGFDQTNQLLIAFPEIGLHSKIYLKHQTVVKEATVPGFFATDFIYGADSYWKQSRVEVVSELPFFLQVNDPEQYISIKQRKKGALYTLTMRLKRPVIKIPVNEQYVARNGKILPWISISTLQEWPELGATLAPKYEEIINEPLPAIMQEIVREAAAEKTLIDKINKVTSRLAEKITYMGDWRTVKGAYIPRHLADIAKSKIGDCKDLSASTAAMLRALSIKAVAACVFRGQQQAPANNLPTIAYFNHAIVAVKDGDKTLWIDPTNFTSFAHGIYADIENKQALVLDPSASELLVTTKIIPENALVTVNKQIALAKTIGAPSTITGTMLFQGGAAESITGADLITSKDNINHALLNAVTDQSKTETSHIDDYNLTSRLVADLTFKFSFVENFSQVKTTSGQAFLLPMNRQVAKLLTKTKDRVTDLAFEQPKIHQYTILLQDALLIGDKFLTCKVDSPWFAGMRDLQNTPAGIKISDTLTFKQRQIALADLKSTSYADMQAKLFSCFGDTALVYAFKRH